jgi:hypothetical protein
MPPSMRGSPVSFLGAAGFTGVDTGQPPGGAEYCGQRHTSQEHSPVARQRHFSAMSTFDAGGNSAPIKSLLTANTSKSANMVPPFK